MSLVHLEYGLAAAFAGACRRWTVSARSSCSFPAFAWKRPTWQSKRCGARWGQPTSTGRKHHDSGRRLRSTGTFEGLTQGRSCNSLSKAGEIHLILGPMFAGKTTALLKRVAQEEAKGLAVALVKSSKDARYSEDEIVSHDGTKRRCDSVTKLGDLRDIIGEDRWVEIDVLAVDEAQFIPDLVRFCVDAADMENKKIIVAGLDGDFRRSRFGDVLDLLPHCDTVTKLTAKCKICLERPALFSLRIAVDKDTQELVGGAEAYTPACRACFVRAEDVPDENSVKG